MAAFMDIVVQPLARLSFHCTFGSEQSFGVTTAFFICEHIGIAQGSTGCLTSERLTKLCISTWVPSNTHLLHPLCFVSRRGRGAWGDA